MIHPLLCDGLYSSIDFYFRQEGDYFSARLRNERSLIFKMKLNFLEQIRTPVNVFFQKVIDVLRERGKGFLYLILKINDAGFVYKPVAKDVIADSNINGWLANLTANRLQFRINRSVIMKEIKLNRCAGWTDAESRASMISLARSKMALSGT